MPNLDKTYIEDTANTRFKLFFDEINFGRLDFLDSFYTRLQQLKKQGLSNEAITNELWNEIIKNKKLESLENQESAHLWDFMKGTSQYTVWSSLDDNTLYKWVWTPGAEHCEGCKARNGKIKTFEEWEKEGLPGSGNTQCHDNCLCDLEEVENPKQQQTDKEPSPAPAPVIATNELPLENQETDFKRMLKQELDNIELNKTNAELEEIKSEMQGILNLKPGRENLAEYIDKWDLKGLDLIKFGDLTDSTPEGTDLAKQFRNLLIAKYTSSDQLLSNKFESWQKVITTINRRTQSPDYKAEEKFNLYLNLNPYYTEFVFSAYTTSEFDFKEFHEEQNKELYKQLYLGSFNYKDTKQYDNIKNIVNQNNKKNKLITNNKGKRNYGRKKSNITTIA